MADDTVVRRLLLEVTEDGEVRVDGFGWASIDTDDGEEMLWIGGDLPDLIIVAREDQTNAPQVIATTVWPLERLETVLATTCLMARQYAVHPDELEDEDEDEEGD